MTGPRVPSHSRDALPPEGLTERPEWTCSRDVPADRPPMSTIEADIEAERLARATWGAGVSGTYVVYVIAASEELAISAVPLVAARVHKDRLFRDVVYIEELGTAYAVRVRYVEPSGDDS